MNKLSKDQKTERDRIIGLIETAREKLDSEIGAFNDALNVQWENVQAALERYNEAIDEAESWTSGIADDIEAYIDEKSNNWRESDRGQGYDLWKEVYQNTGIEQLEIDKPDDLAPDIEDVAQILNSLDEEPS